MILILPTWGQVHHLQEVPAVVFRHWHKYIRATYHTFLLDNKSGHLENVAGQTLQWKMLSHAFLKFCQREWHYILPFYTRGVFEPCHVIVVCGSGPGGSRPHNRRHARLRGTKQPQLGRTAAVESNSSVRFKCLLTHSCLKLLLLTDAGCRGHGFK